MRKTISYFYFLFPYIFISETIKRRQYNEGKKYIIPCVNTTAREITPEGVICTDLQGKEIFVKADTVILSAGMRPRTKVVEELEGVVDEFYMIGDCVKAGQVTQAMSQAYFTAREI